MSIPLISNIGFTEVNSEGNLNTKAGTAKSKMPIQLFKLTDNISGNLTLDNSSFHKKIILDTNGKTITNSTGSPLTTNSSTNLELKGSGNIQCTLKTFTSAETSTGNTGTTTIADADNSTVLVGTDHTFTSSLTSFSGQADISGGGSGQAEFEEMYNTTWAGYVGGNLMPNVNDAAFRMQFNDAFVEDNPKGGGLIVGPGGGGQSSYTSNAGRTSSPTTPSSNVVVNGFRIMTWSSAGFDPRSGNMYTITMRVHPTNGRLQIGISNTSDPRYELISNGVIPNAITNTGRKFTFTNNLAISTVLTGNDPFNSVTVTSGGTNAQTRDSTDGSFSLTGTISGNNGSGQPFALKPVNNGSGNVVVTDYSGTLSASAL